jgi:hypothetical protein
MKISLENLLQNTKAGWVTVYDMINTLQQQIEAFAGNLIFIGTIDLDTPDVTQAILDAKAQELGKYPLSKGYVLVDNNTNNWWHNGTEWVNIGYYDAAQAANPPPGTSNGSTDSTKVSVNLSGEMSVNGLFLGTPYEITLGDGSRTQIAGGADNLIKKLLAAGYINSSLFNSPSGVYLPILFSPEDNAAFGFQDIRPFFMDATRWAAFSAPHGINTGGSDSSSGSSLPDASAMMPAAYWMGYFYRAINAKQNKLSGDPMQLVHGDGSFTPGFMEVAHTLDGIYSNFPLIPDAVNYTILTAPDKLYVVIYAFDSCSRNTKVAAGKRDSVEDAYSVLGTWENLATGTMLNAKADASAVATQSATYTFGIATLELYKFGKVVCCQLNISSSSNSRTLSTGVMPAGYLPIRGLTNVVPLVTKGPSAPLCYDRNLELSIYTNGNITLNQLSTSTEGSLMPLYSSCSYSFSYVTV